MALPIRIDPPVLPLDVLALSSLLPQAVSPRPVSIAVAVATATVPRLLISSHLCSLSRRADAHHGGYLPRLMANCT